MHASVNITFELFYDHEIYILFLMSLIIKREQGLFDLTGIGELMTDTIQHKYLIDN